MNCIHCGKETLSNSAAACFSGVYCNTCALELGYTPEQIGADRYFPRLYKTEVEPEIEKPLWAKGNPFLKVQLRPKELDVLESEGSITCSVTEKIYTSLVEKEDEATVRAIIEYATEQGFTAMLLIDKKLIHEALKKQIQTEPIEEADDFGDRSLCCPNCIGPVTNYWAPGTKPKHCQFCGQALKWEEEPAK
jgi:hypothetical protein